VSEDAALQVVVKFALHMAGRPLALGSVAREARKVSRCLVALGAGIDETVLLILTIRSPWLVMINGHLASDIRYNTPQ
jgi:hypothetical protein